MFENLISALKAEKRTIVFTEGEDARILEAASRLKKDGLMDSIRQPIPRWTRWSRRWSSCARAR